MQVQMWLDQKSDWSLEASGQTFIYSTFQWDKNLHDLYSAAFSRLRDSKLVVSSGHMAPFVQSTQILYTLEYTWTANK